MTETHTSRPVPTGTGRAAGSIRPPSRAVDVLLADGRIATIRSLVAEDEQALLRLHDTADEDSIRLRFFVANRAAARAYAQKLVRADPRTVIVLVAAVGDDLLGVAAAELLDAESADVAFLVDSRAQGLGVGTLLLEHLAAEAYDRGVRRFLAEVLTENIAMLRVFRDAGFGYHLTVDRGVVSVELDTTATPIAVAAADEREAAAEARSLRAVLDPHSIAVVGVRRDGTGVGHAIWSSLRDGGYTGALHVVHPDIQRIGGATVYRTLRDVPEPIDLVIVAVPAAAVPAVIDDAAAASAGAAIVLSAGFSELGEAGARAQQQILVTARRHNLRIIGPNCMGVLNTDPAIAMNATFATVRPQPGGLAIASQSGGVGIALLESARRAGLGISQFVSLGNKVDVSGNDLLAAWLADSRVTAAAFYLESFGNAVKFARLARRFALQRPLLAIVGGRSAGGIRAGASHTAAAAASGIGVEALFDQAGVIGCTGIDDLVTTARLLDRHPLPAGDRLGIVGNAGGLGILAADAADRQGLAVPRLSGQATASLAAALGPGTPMNGHATENPVDLGAGVAPAAFVAATAALIDSDEVDAVLIILAATAVTDPQAVLDGLADRYAAAPTKPVLFVGYGIGDCRVPEVLNRSADVEQACQALAHAVGYRRWRDAAGPADPTADLAVGAAGPVADTVAETARAVAASYLERPEVIARDGWLDIDQAADLLEPYGIPVLSSRRVVDADAAAHAADQIGYPVVIKAADPSIVHKTDRGLVRPGVADAIEVRRAVAQLHRRLAAGDGRARTELLVQEQVGTGIELALGIARDSSFGPLIMVAAGGVTFDVWNDRRFLMAPVSARDVARTLRRLRIWPLLAGFRGSPPVDIDALERLVVALGRLAVDLPEVAELDLNPVIARPDRLACVDVKLRLRARTLWRTTARALRMPAAEGATPATPASQGSAAETDEVHPNTATASAGRRSAERTQTEPRTDRP